MTIAQCSKEKILEITWRNCNFVILVVVLLNLQIMHIFTGVCAIAIMQIQEES